MSINPLPPAHYTPDQEGYSGVKPFRFWCQKVLPLVYDDSLSYYELLCKVIHYLNETISDVAAVEGNVEALHTAYTQLQTYVNNYFSTLDVQEEIDNKLDEMASDGTLTELLLPFIPDIITGWLTENVTPTGSVVMLDKTLTVENAAADAKSTGRSINFQRDRITALDSSKMDNPTIADDGKIPMCIGGEVVWVVPSTPTPSQVDEAVSEWLDEHPEATTTVNFNVVTKTFLTALNMISDASLDVGDKAKTTGYYSSNDGGAGLYVIKEEADDNDFYITLTNGLVAVLIADRVNIKQLGIRPNTDDIHNILLEIFEKRSRPKIYIPSGIWKCSETELYSAVGFDIIGDYSFPSVGNSNYGTIITAYENNQSYIWKIGSADTAESTDKPTTNFNLENIAFSSGIYVGGALTNYYSVNRAALVLEGATFGKIATNFSGVYGTALAIDGSWEIYFKDMSFRWCGTPTKPCLNLESTSFTTTSGANISACCFDSLMFEACSGQYIKANSGCKFDSNIIKYINVEGSFNTIFEGTQGLTTETTYTAIPLFEFYDATGLQIESINIQHLFDYTYTLNGTKYKMKSVLSIPTNGNVQLQVNNIIIGITTKGFEVLNSDTPNNRTVVEIGNINVYTEGLVAETIETIPPIFNVSAFTQLYVNTFNAVKSWNRNFHNCAFGIPFYKLAKPDIANNIRSIYADNDAANELRLCVKPKETNNDNYVVRFVSDGKDHVFRVKGTQGETLKTRFTGVKNGLGYGADVTVECTGSYQLVTVATSNIDAGTDVTIYDKGTNVSEHNTVLSYDTIY